MFFYEKSILSIIVNFSKVGRNFFSSGRFHAGLHDRARTDSRSSAPLPEKERQASRSLRRQAEGSRRLGQRESTKRTNIDEEIKNEKKNSLQIALKKNYIVIFYIVILP